jgi:hypothetical protein
MRSRKLWVTLASAAAIVASAIGGQVEWSQATWQIVLLAGSYLGIQGAIDHKAAGVPPQ